jgi:hypothetical protein
LLRLIFTFKKVEKSGVSEIKPENPEIDAKNRKVGSSGYSVKKKNQKPIDITLKYIRIF